MHPIVLLHGTGESPAAWSRVVAELPSDAVIHRPRLAPGAEPDPSLDRFVLVGHSYGGWEALRWACERPERVRELVLLEPVLFALLDGVEDEELKVVKDCCSDFSPEGLVDYWHGQGAWGRLPGSAKEKLEAQRPDLRVQLARALELPAPVEVLASLQVSTRLLCGDSSPRAARRVCEILAGVLPRAELRVLPGAGHDMHRSHAVDIAAAIGRGEA